MFYPTLLLLLVLTALTFSQDRFSKNEISLNGFRNPSIGAEYRYNQLSLHLGYYLTNFSSGSTTEFLRTGLSFWFLPIGRMENPSSFYSSLSYALGLSKEYKDKHSFIAEAGFRFMIWNGINLRLGIAALSAKGETLKINPTPGISYSFFFN
jgi:hypothetical protein